MRGGVTFSSLEWRYPRLTSVFRCLKEVSPYYSETILVEVFGLFNIPEWDSGKKLVGDEHVFSKKNYSMISI